MADSPTSVSVTKDIAAPPERVWELVTDLARMGEWSSESTGGEWVHGWSGPALGARFRGTNRNGRKTWSTQVTITTFDAPGLFEFEVKAIGVKVAR